MKPFLHHGLFLAALTCASLVQAEEFDIVHIGDIHVGVGDRGIDHMTTWVKNNQVLKNIKLMSQTGDMVNTGNNDSYFNTAASSFLAPMLTLADKMAIGVSTGNHDYASYVGSVPQSHTDANRWIGKFGDATWLPYQSTWYLGKNPADESHVQTFTAGGYTFLNISLEWFHSNSSSVWLKSILDANPTKPTIISTHSYLVPWVGDLRRVSPEGDSVWAIIKNYPQVFLVLSGHVWATTVDGSVATRTVTNTKGSQVMETVCDFQNCTPANGWVRLFNIDTVSTTGNIKVTTIPTINGTPNTTDDFTGSLDFVSRFGPPSGGGDDTTPPSAPGGLAGTSTPNSALLTWQAAIDPAPSSGIKGYDVDRGTAGSTVFVTGTSLDVTGLAASTLYTFRVQAIDTAGNRSEWSSVQVTTQEAGLSAFVMGINLNGNAVTIESNAWRSYATALSNGLSVSTTPLTAATALTPSPTTDADTSAMLNSAIYVQGNWTLSQTLTNGTYDVYFWVMENDLSNCRNFNIQLEGTTVATGIGSMAKNAWVKYGPYRTLVSDGQLNMGVVKVTGDPNLMGVAIFSVTLDTEAPSIPANLTATAQSSTSILVTWDNASDNVAVTGYDIYRNDELVGTSPTASFTDTGLTPFTFYRYKIKAKDAAGNASDFSADASATTQATAVPAAVLVEETFDSYATGGNIGGLNGGTGWTAAWVSTRAAAYTTIVAGNVNGQGTGNKMSFGYSSTTPQNSRTFTPIDDNIDATYWLGFELQVPSMKSSHTLSLNGTTGTMITMTAATSGAAPTYQFFGTTVVTPASTAVQFFVVKIEMSVAGNETLTCYVNPNFLTEQNTWPVAASSNQEITTITGITLRGNQNTGTYWTYLDNIRLATTWQGAVGQGTSSADTVAPTQPANLTATAQSCTSIALTWSASTDAVGVTAYDVYRGETLVGSPATNSYTDSGLTASTMYSYSVKARDAAGNASDASTAASATTFTPVENWRKTKFGDEHNEGDAADDQDPNHNGIKNLLEYALDGEPLGHTTGLAILPQADRDSNNKLRLRFNRYLDRKDLKLTAQAADSIEGPWEDVAVSTAGATFAPIGAATATESGADNTYNVTVTDFYQIGDPAHPKRFMRLKAEK